MPKPSKPHFDAKCRQCSRLATFLDEVKQQHPDYDCKPVPPFGAADAKLLVVGLAPGMHGANATGRPFTGDHAGILLYQTLYECGLSSAAESIAANDKLKLHNCRITNAVKCLPPQNKPVGAEINTCNTFLANELNDMPDNSVILALGTIAHNAVIKALSLKQKDYKFGHGNEHDIPLGTLIDSYHCSRYNTNTRRLTTGMFRDVFNRAKQLIS